MSSNIILEYRFRFFLQIDLNSAIIFLSFSFIMVRLNLSGLFFVMISIIVTLSEIKS